MLIQTETTPSPDTLSFVLGQGAESSLVSHLLKIEGVVDALLDKRRVIVTKHKSVTWESIKPLILQALEEQSPSNSHTETDPIIIQIREVLETRVRPLLSQDGGDVFFHDFKDGIVYVELQGACQGCPRSQETLKNGIGMVLKHFVPEVIGVSEVHA